MPSESKPLLTAQTEKPNHYSYLKEFRVDQCPLFLQHKCTQHRPYTCFHWHFMNQRRRRPVRKRDGAFNYSADNYCTKFDETTGLCPDGDDCQFLHRTAGDTERRYHLRYYKTCMCVHDTDSRGYCVKNGPHCAFAHGNNDIRPPVFDIKEIQAAENQDAEGNGTGNGPNVLDKERNLMNEDPKWQDTNYVLANYKTEQCKRPPRLCRQGYACPQFHNSRDKRRSPRKFKYRSTPCPSVKHGDEWGEPSSCDAGDACQYCHTRTEQQFHPEIYKSTKCNDVQQAGYCPRGVFCAFAHVDQEMCIARDLAAPHDSGTNLGEILSNALPSVDNRPQTKPEDKGSESPNGSSEVSESASTSSLCSNGSHSRAPGAQLAHNRVENNHFHPQNSAQDLLNGGVIRNEIIAIDNDPNLDSQEKDQRKQSLYRAFSSSQTNSLNPLGLAIASSFYGHNDTIEAVVGNALEELHLDDAINLAASMDREYETESPTIANPISASLSSGLSSGLLVGSAPVNIPGSSLNERTNCLGNFSPSTSSPLHHIQSSFLSASRFPHQESLDSNPAFLNHLPCSSSASKISGSHFPMTNVNSGSVGSVGPGPVGSNLFDFHNLSPGSRGHPSVVNSFPISPSIANNSPSEIHKLREELSSSRSKLATWDENLSHLRTACEAWQQEAADRERRAKVAELQRDEVLKQLKVLQIELERMQNNPYVHTLNRASDLRSMSIPMLKALQAQLRTDLEEIDKVLYHQTAAKCMVCEEQDRSVTLRPCNHLVLCILCAPKQNECPYCQTPTSPNAATVS